MDNTRSGPNKQKKQDLISLCQKQQAIAKLEGKFCGLYDIFIIFMSFHNRHH